MALKRFTSNRRASGFFSSRSTVATVALILTNIVTMLSLYCNISGSMFSQIRISLPLSSQTSSELSAGQEVQGFVLYSAYRTSSLKLVVIGLAKLSLHNEMKTEGCRWSQQDGTQIFGRITVKYPGDAHKKMYEVALLECKFQTSSEGSTGGQLFITIGGEEVEVYREKAGDNAAAELQDQSVPPFKHKLSYCSSPIYGNINEERFVEWVEYHRAIHGIEFFYFYNAGGIDVSLKERLKPYIDADMAEIIDVQDFNRFDTWLYAQVLVINDCAFRTRFSSEWSLFMDFDEYLHASTDTHSILPILDMNQGRPWVTFGSIFYYTDKCTHSANVSQGAPQPWEVEKLVFRQADVHCKNVEKYGSRERCLEYDGHRKYAIDPRQIEVCGIHKVVYPSSGGLHTSTEDVLITHFRGINTKQVKTCTQYIYDTDRIPPSWARDFTIARAAQTVRLRVK